MCKAAAFTLMELLTTLTVLSVLGAIAVPGFVKLRLDSERSATVNSFLHALFLARSEAVRRGTVISLCRSPDSRHCAYGTAQWAQGWIVFVNRDRDEPPQRDPGEEILAAYAGWSGAGGHISSNRPAYSFRSYRQGVVNGTIIFCDRRGAAHARAIIVNHAGRPRLATRAAGGKPLRCPSG